MKEETSNIVVLTGDSSPVLSVGFDSIGNNLASGGFMLYILSLVVVCCIACNCSIRKYIVHFLF